MLTDQSADRKVGLDPSPANSNGRPEFLIRAQDNRVGFLAKYVAVVSAKKHDRERKDHVHAFGTLDASTLMEVSQLLMVLRNRALMLEYTGHQG